MKLLIYPAIDDQRLQKIRSVDSRLTVVNARDEAEAGREIIDADALFGRVTRELLAAARQLCWIQSPTASLEHYVFPELVEHPAVLTNMRGLFSDIIADQVIGYIICFARNLHIYIRNQRDAVWAPVGGESQRVGFATGPAYVTEIDRAHRHLADMTLGIVGLGNIGTELARRARAFQMDVVAVDPVRQDQPEEVRSLWRPEQLDRLLAESDMVAITAPHTPQTVKMFRRAQLRAMKPSAYLINVGRGVIVDLEDLCDALEAGDLAGAALDVFETEPLPSQHRFWKLPNVILTPHVAGFAPPVAQRHLQVVLDNVQRFVQGQPLRNVVDKRAWF